MMARRGHTKAKRGDAIRDHREMASRLARYELGALSDEERRVFEAHLLECDACFAELERGSVVTSQMLDHAAHLVRVADPGRVGLAERIGRWLALIAHSLRPRVAVPAVLLVMALILVGRELVTAPDVRDLATFPREEIPVETLRGPGDADPVDELMASGAGYFNLGRYEEAVRHFEAALHRDPQRAEAAYLAGLSRALAGDPYGALQPLSEAVRLSQGPVRRKAQWALANAHLAAGDLRQSRSVLEEIARDGGEYAATAAELLGKLPD